MIILLLFKLEVTFSNKFQLFKNELSVTILLVGVEKHWITVSENFRQYLISDFKNLTDFCI